VDPFGMVFVVHPTHGHVFAGVFKNRLGHGWTKLDGFGVINAEKAVLGAG
jgi:hypothetical protein